jgi:hypothetical protein
MLRIRCEAADAPKKPAGADLPQAEQRAGQRELLESRLAVVV